MAAPVEVEAEAEEIQEEDTAPEEEEDTTLELLETGVMRKEP